MRIVDLKMTIFAFRQTTDNQVHQADELGLLSIETDVGITGVSLLGEPRRGALLDALSLVRALKPIVVGENALDHERIWQNMIRRHRDTTLRAIGAVDVALWDLAGKIAGQPIHGLLGRTREKAPAYLTLTGLERLERYVDEARKAYAKGYRALKIHPPCELGVAEEICRAVRQALPPEIKLMADFAWSLNLGEAVRIGRVLEKLNYNWFEDPLPMDDIENYSSLRRKLDIPILATERASGGFSGFSRWIRAEATDFLRGDPGSKGGITALIKGAHVAEAFNLRFELHHGGNAANNAANLNLLMSLSNAEYFEMAYSGELQYHGVRDPICIDSEGFVHAPTGSGLGLNIDNSCIEALTVDVIG